MNTLGAKNIAGYRIARGAALAATMLAMTLVGAPKLAGQDSWHKWNCGVQTGALMPTGDKLKSVAENGVGVAGYVEIMWSNGWALRGRAEYTAFGEKELGYASKANVTQTGGMLDLIYYSRVSKLYPFIGIGSFSRSGKKKIGDSTSDLKLDPSTAISVGCGWNFTNHLGLEVKYSITESSWAQVSILYRF